MKITRNIKSIRIDWLKVAAAVSASNPYGPMIGPDGTVYACDGSVLVPGSETAAAATTSPLPAAPASSAARTSRPVSRARVGHVIAA